MPQPVSVIEGCGGCPIRDKFPLSPFVPPKAGTGKVLTIGEKPGADEGRIGEPFVVNDQRHAVGLEPSVGPE